MSIKHTNYKALQVILCIDGNSDDDYYMYEVFADVFPEHAFFRWDYNFHHLPPELPDPSQNGAKQLVHAIRRNKFVCIMQMWGGKREVMYTVFRPLGNTVKYVQVCDSDTKLDVDATLELVKVLESDETIGAVGGDVKILNSGDSFISFLSSLRYWMAFNIERSCQSFFGCVSCISGPSAYIGWVLQKFLHMWSDQKFMGTYCTFDDRHLTNRMLQMGMQRRLALSMAAQKHRLPTCAG